jgi:hypothetical protein
MTKNRPSPHQHHSVVNRNALLRERRARDALAGAPPITSYAGSSVVSDELEQRLKVVAERHFKIIVEHHMGEGKFSYEDAPNPINQLGPVHQGRTPLVTSNDYASFMAAFNKRSNFMQGTDDDVSDEAFKEAMEIISEVPDGLFDNWDENDFDRDRWMSKFDPSKQKRMSDAYGEVPHATSAYIGKKDLSVKQETLIKRDDPEWAPRVIYAGNDVFNTLTGPPSMVVMERAVHLTRVLKIPIGEVLVEFAYKTTDVSLCDFLMADPDLKETVEGDFSRNDREQRSRVALIYDAWLAKLGMPSWFRKLLLDLEHYTVQNLRFGFTAKLAFQLPTGTTSTTPRNSLYNGTMFAVAVRRQIQDKTKAMMLKSGKTTCARCVILGDDILGQLFKRLCLDGWVKTVADFKMVLKAKAPRLDGAATFLSRRIFADVDRPCMIPLLGKMLVRFNVRATINDDVSDSAYMAGKALSYAYECRHVPFISRIFLERFEMEDDKSAVRLQDLTWFTKTSGHSLDNIVRAIRDETTLIDESDFGFWCCLQYDLDLEEVRELFEQTVLSATPSSLDLPNIANMDCDL